jgi:hypothetical protein
MTPRSSVRARAREVYDELAQKLSPCESTAAPTSDPSSLRDGEASYSPRRASANGGGEKNDLTARVRDLYEKSAVPVREIAGIAGVTERTLYRYVEKGDWTRRYQILPRGEAAAAANRGRRWEVSPDRTKDLAGDLSADVAPAKGAGGRFIRREDKGKPFATGLKSLDPEGRSRALATAGKAKRLSRVAQQMAEIDAARAELLRGADSRVATIRHMVSYLRNISKIEAMLKQREAALKLREDKAKEAKSPEQDMEMRVELARRITAMLDQRRAANQQSSGSASAPAADHEKAAGGDL